jgi:hypothetical protein
LWSIGLLVLLPLAVVFVAVFRNVPARLRRPPQAMQHWIDSIVVADRAATARLRPDAHPVPWDDPHPPPDIDTYVNFQLLRGGYDAGAALYLDAHNRFRADDLDATWRRAAVVAPSPDPSMERLWQSHLPMPPPLVEWLTDHADWIALLRRMIAAGGPPLPTAEEIFATDPAFAHLNPNPDYLFWQRADSALRAESRRLRESGDTEAAADTLADAFRLSTMIRFETSLGGLLAIGMQTLASHELCVWLEHAPPDPALAARLRVIVDSPELDGLPLVTQGFLVFSYVSSRGILLQMLEQSPTRMTVAQLENFAIKRPLGYDSTRPPGYFDHLKRNPSQVLGITLNAGYLKATVGSRLRQFDVFWLDCLQHAEGPATPAFPDPALRKAAEEMFEPAFMMLPNYENPILRATRLRTLMALERLALRRLDGTGLPDPATPNDPDWSASPWRDPFTGKPLKIIDDGTESLFYSLGPDLEDQGGQIVYDPTNGMISPGDLTLRLPR